MEGSSVCVVCSHHTNAREGRRRTRGAGLSEDYWGNEEERSRSRLLLEEFCRELGDHDHVGELLEEVLQDQGGMTLLCLTCVPFVERAMEERRRCKVTEERVNQLQLSILEELRGLKEGMTQFRVELEGVGELMEDLADFDAEGPVNNLLRNRIYEVVSELRDYQNGLSIKLLCRPEIKIEPLEEDYVPVPEQESGMMEWDPDSNSWIDDLLDNNNDQSQSKRPTTPKHRDSDRKDRKAGSDSAASEGGSDWEQDSNEQDEGAQSHSGSASDSESDYAPSSSKKARLSSNPKTRNRKPSRSKVITPTFIAAEGKLDNDGDGMDDPVSGIDDDDDFKKRFISKALRQQKAEAKFATRPDLEYKKHYMEYDNLTEKLTLGGVELHFNNKTVNNDDAAEEETQQLVQCGSCPFTVTYSETLSTLTGKRKGSIQVTVRMTRDISAHVHAAHLDTFMCPVCGMRKKDRRDYVKHMDRVHGGTIPCGVCGRPMKTNDALATHLWTHMSEEEKANAIQSGVKNPRSYHDSLKNQELYCSMCGKRFKYRKNLIMHEKAHSGEREMVVCPVCGKLVLKTTYKSYHRRYVCPLTNDGSVEHLPVKCTHCPQVLKNHRFLQNHIRRFHSFGEGEDPRPHLCSVCGKGYKAKGDLQLHMRIHQEDTFWSCSLGCGKQFNVKRNCKRHEVSCGGGRKKKAAGAGKRKLAVKKGEAWKEEEDSEDESD